MWIVETLKLYTVHYRLYILYYVLYTIYFVQVWAGCVQIGPDKPYVEAAGEFSFLPNQNSRLYSPVSQACIGEPPVHRDFHSATAIGKAIGHGHYISHHFLDFLPQGSLMFIFGGRSDLTGGQWQVNMGPDYYSNKVWCVRVNNNYWIYTWKPPTGKRGIVSGQSVCFRCATLTQPRLPGTIPV